MNKDYVSIREACKILDVGASTVYNYISTGKLPSKEETLTVVFTRLVRKDVEAFKLTYKPKPYNKKRPKKLDGYKSKRAY